MALPSLDDIATPLLAPASLIPAAPAFIILILGGLAAIVLGYAAVRQERTGERLARAAIVLGTLGLLATSFLVLRLLLSPGHPAVGDVRCASHLRQIYQATLLYANENHGQCPPRLEDLLLTQDIGPYVFICPASNDTPAPGPTTQAVAKNLSTGGHLSYIYLGAGHMMTSSPSSTAVLLYEPLSNHAHACAHVVYFDGRVAFLPAPQARQLLQSLKPATRPHS